MGTDIKEEHNVPRPQGGDRGNKNNNRRRGHCTRIRWNNTAAGGTPSPGNKFKSRIKDIAEDLTFNNTGPNNVVNFQHALRGIADYLHTTYSVDVADAIHHMKVVVIDIPDPSAIKQDKSGNDIPILSIDEYKWKEEYKEQIMRKRLYDMSMPKTLTSQKPKVDLQNLQCCPAERTASSST